MGTKYLSMSSYTICTH